MPEFRLDDRLRDDTHRLGLINGQVLLLLDNALLPWFVVVPMVDATELYELPPAEQARLLDNVNMLSRHLRAHYPLTKVNVAAIGNIVRQLHVHIVGRSEQDHAWPGTVWGRPEREPYAAGAVREIGRRLLADPAVAGFEPAET